MITKNVALNLPLINLITQWALVLWGFFLYPLLDRIRNLKVNLPRAELNYLF